MPTVCCAVIALHASGQDIRHNFVVEKTMLDPTANDALCCVAYHDGLGRMTEKATYATNGAKPLYSVASYDSKGRIDKAVTPFAYGTAPDCLSFEDAIERAAEFHRDGTPVSVFGYDTEDCAVSASITGDLWKRNGKRTAAEHSANTKDDKVLIFSAPLGNVSLVKPGANGDYWYHEGTLTKNVTTDADGKTLTVFKDIQGNTVLERRDIGDTYFVYNILGQLRFVLSPMYQHSGYKDKYAYEYRYDARGNMVKRILPGCGYEQFWYDAEKRLTFCQDARLRERGRYRFFLYDRYGRLAIQGTCGDCGRGIRFRNATVSFSNYAPGISDTGYEWTGNDKLELDDISIEKVCHYDSYAFIGRFPASHQNLYDKSNASLGKGRLTGYIERTSDGKFVYRTCQYDAKGNVVRVINDGTDNRTAVTVSSYSFTDKLLKSSTDVYEGGNVVFSVSENYEYDRSNNLAGKFSVTVNAWGKSAAAETEYEYDGLNRLAAVRRPGGAGCVSYSYDLHGWTRKIDGKAFCERLYYADGSGTPCYNGNISSMTWSTQGYGQMRGYKFEYDKLDRLADAVYGEGDGLDARKDRYNEHIEYDMNGNITRLQRRGKKQNGVYGKIDNLNVKLNGNQADFVEDDAERILYKGAFDFNVAGNDRAEFSYDACGALTADTGRGIASISYCNSGFPKRILFGNACSTEYTYTAGGEKMQAVHKIAMPNVGVPTGGIKELPDEWVLSISIADYMLGGRLVFMNGKPDRFLFEGGYFKIKKDSITAYYYDRDHLGNIRAVTSERGDVVQTADYYPFGAPFCDNADADRPTRQPYKFNGKELDMEHGLNTYDYGARQYYPALPMWDRPDPMCENYYHVSPYAYCNGNPVKRNDFQGMFYGDYYDKHGNLLGNDGVDDNNRYIVLNNNDKKDIVYNTKHNIKFERKDITSSIILPSNETIALAQEAFDRSDKDNYEYGFVCTTNGKVSRLLTDYETESVRVGYGYQELTDAGLQTSFDVHVHPFTPSVNGNQYTIGDIKPSGTKGGTRGDYGYRQLKEKQNMVTEPSWVLGTENINGTPGNKIVTFYNSQGVIGNIHWNKLAHQ